jgi:hypothetical protein
MKCVVNRRMTGHVRVSSLGMRYQGRGKCYTLEHTETARPDPRDPRQHRHFVNHNGTVYYVTANNHQAGISDQAPWSPPFGEILTPWYIRDFSLPPHTYAI